MERDAGEEGAGERHALRILVEDVVLDCAVRLLPTAPPPFCAACCDVVAARAVDVLALPPPPLLSQRERGLGVRAGPVVLALAMT